MAQQNLTSGSIPGGILRLAVPMIVAGTLQSIQAIVDMSFVGRLGPEALAAVGMSAATMMVLITVFIGINISTGAMVSRAIGAGEEDRAGLVASQSLLLTVLCSVAIGAVGYIYAPAFLKALGADSHVVRLGAGYLHISFAGITFLSSTFVLSGIFNGAGHAKTSMLLGLLMTATNVILNPLLIFGCLGFPAMGVRGSALATVIARAVSCVAGVFLFARGRLRVRCHVRDFVPHPKVMWKVVAIGVPGSLQMSVRTLMGLLLITIVAKFGTLTVAAYTVGQRLWMIGLLSLFGFAGSAATMVGQNLGAKRPDRSQKSALTAAAMGVTTAGVSSLVLFTLAPHLVALFNDTPEVVASGTVYIRTTAFALIAAAVSIILGRSLAGAGDTLSPFIITLLVLWGYQIPAAVYLSGVPEIWGVIVPRPGVLASFDGFGERGIWYAMVSTSVIQSVVTAAWFSLGRWKRKKV